MLSESHAIPLCNVYERQSVPLWGFAARLRAQTRGFVAGEVGVWQVEAASLRAEGAAFCLDTDEFALDLAVSLWFGSGIRSLKSAQHVGLAAQEVAADQVDGDALAVAAEFAALALGQRRDAEFFHEGGEGRGHLVDHAVEPPVGVERVHAGGDGVAHDGER